jgi:predicted nucleic acid-binding protein
MNRVFIDTSGWVALFVKNDSNNRSAAGIFERIRKEDVDIYTSDYVLDETITLIRMKGDHAASVMAGKAIFESRIIKLVNVAPDFLEGTWKLYQKYKDKKFSFTDVSSLEIMKELGIGKALSFDREFSQAGIELL